LAGREKKQSWPKKKKKLAGTENAIEMKTVTTDAYTQNFCEGTFIGNKDYRGLVKRKSERPNLQVNLYTTLIGNRPATKMKENEDKI